MGDSSGNTETLTIPGYMIDHDAASKISESLLDSKVFVKSELSIEIEDNRLEIGLFISSSVDVSPEVMDTFSRLAFESVTTAHESAIELHIHTFACPLCPAFIKEEDCVSDGKYCAYFPKKNDYWIEDMDSEDHQHSEDLEFSEFTGR